MLQFVLGRAGSGKTEYLRRLLADRSLAGFGGTVMIVPEQYTFETEKAMLRLAGPVRGNAIPVRRRRRGPQAQRWGQAHLDGLRH